MYSRYRIIKNENLKILIRTPKRIGLLFFIFFFISIWIYVGILVAFNSNNMDADKVAITLFVIVWIFAVFYSFAILAWNLFGKEEITFSKDTLTINRIVFFTIKTKKFALSEIYDIRYKKYFNFGLTKEGSMADLGFRGEVIKFYCGVDEYGFGINLDEESAEIIIKKIKDYLKANN